MNLTSRELTPELIQNRTPKEVYEKRYRENNNTLGTIFLYETIGLGDKDKNQVAFGDIPEYTIFADWLDELSKASEEKIPELVKGYIDLFRTGKLSISDVSGQTYPVEVKYSATYVFDEHGEERGTQLIFENGKVIGDHILEILI